MIFQAGKIHIAHQKGKCILAVAGFTVIHEISLLISSRIHQDQEYITPNQPSPRVLVIFFNNRWCMI
jgi:hypothetical protein